MCIGGFCLNKRMPLYSAHCVDETETHLSVRVIGVIWCGSAGRYASNGISLIDCLVKNSNFLNYWYYITRHLGAAPIKEYEKLQ